MDSTVASDAESSSRDTFSAPAQPGPAITQSAVIAQTAQAEGNTDSEELTVASGATLPRAERRRRSFRKSLVAALVVLLVASTAAAGWFLLRETDEDRYLSALASEGFEDQYATPDVAVAAGQALCTSLASGTEPEGFDYELVAVTELCNEYADSFNVVPTEEQLAQEYTDRLRKEGLGGRFASDATAVAHAQATCRALEDGADQQGPEVDAIGVSTYCPDYESGFKTLYPIKVKGTFGLSESDPSVYFPSIEGTNSDCAGTGGYSDISEGREVRVTNSSGDLLDTATLSQGRGYPPFTCEFRFSFTVMDGEQGGYMVEVSSRGSIHYSAANLKIPASVELTLGD